MNDDHISQDLANQLLKMEKVRENDTEYDFPSLGGELRVVLFSVDQKEEFFLDIRRSFINLSRTKYQSRARKNIILLRLDINGGPHRNPDGQEVGSPHVHIYREGYNDKWAYELPKEFKNINDPWETLLDFYRYCNITKPPIIRKGLFT
jgi:hypothetical protein